MTKSTMSIIWKLLVASLVVGLALDFFDVSPADLIHDIPQTIGRVYDLAVGVIEWGGRYILLGAIIVVPVWLVLNLTWLKNRFRRKN